MVGREQRTVEDFAGWVEVRRCVVLPLAFVLVLLLILGESLQDEALVVGVEDLKTGFNVVDLILGLDGLLARVELN